MLKKLALAVVALVAMVVIIGLARGSHWKVEKTVAIDAPPEAIQPFVVDLQKGWPQWATWHAMDPKATWTYAGTPGAVGQSMSWQGPEIGKGTLTLTKIEPLLVAYDGAIESNDVNDKGTLTFTPEAAGTRVVWLDEGDAPPVVGGLFKGMLEAMLGEQFQKNLDALKVVVEKQQVAAQAVAAQAAAAQAEQAAAAQAEQAEQAAPPPRDPTAVP